MRIKTHFRSAYACVLLAIAATAVSGQNQAGIKDVVAADARPELVQEKFTFTEGPVGTADGGLYFSDIMGADKTYRLDPGGKVALYRSDTNNMNGMALMRDGSLIGAETKRISAIPFMLFVSAPIRLPSRIS